MNLHKNPINLDRASAVTRVLHQHPFWGMFFCSSYITIAIEQCLEEESDIVWREQNRNPFFAHWELFKEFAMEIICCS